MGVLFMGGERLQRGRGIGGILKLASKIFSPLKSLAQTAIKSDSGKQVVNALKKQAVASSINIANDIASGKNIKKSLKDELVEVKNKTKRKAFQLGSEYLNGKLSKDENPPKKKRQNKKNGKKNKRKKDILS